MLEEADNSYKSQKLINLRHRIELETKAILRFEKISQSWRRPEDDVNSQFVSIVSYSRPSLMTAGAFSVITNLRMELFETLANTRQSKQWTDHWSSTDHLSSGPCSLRTLTKPSRLSMPMSHIKQLSAPLAPELAGVARQAVAPRAREGFAFLAAAPPASSSHRSAVHRSSAA